MSAFPMVTVESSSIKEVGWERESETLRIIFCSGAVYDYAGVSHKLYRDLLAAESKGKFFLSEIQGKFAFIKVSTEMWRGKNGESKNSSKKRKRVS